MTMTNMIKKRVAELEGAQLDWAVAVAEGIGPKWFDNNPPQHTVRINNHSFHPVEDWAKGGPIIERELIWLAAPMGMRVQWSAAVDEATDSARGPTPLIAAMRAFVASKLGYEVEVPA